MKRYISIFIFFAVITVICMICGCKSRNTEDNETKETIVTETDAESVTESETDAETEEQTVAAAENYIAVSADKMEINTAGETLNLHILCQQKTENAVGYSLTAVLSSDENGNEVVSFSTSVGSVEQMLTLEYPSSKQSELLYISVSVALTDADKADFMPVSLSLRVKNGLPQLTSDGVKIVVNAMTDEEKARLLAGTGSPVKAGASGGTYAIERLGVPSITVNDGPAGVRYGTAVWYPSISNISSSWDSELISKVGKAIGEDALAIGIDVVLGPGMNIQKNVLGGRNFEYSSEDPLLTGILMSAYVNGMQSTGTGACIKHYAANNQEISRGTVSANVTERALREIYLKGFGIAVENANPWTIMSSYNCLNGIHTCVSSDLLTGILRDEFGFKGFVMTDWGSTGTMADKVNAGNDVTMPGNGTDYVDVLEALYNGTVKKETIDLCCKNILSVVAKSAIYNDLHEDRVNQTEKAKLNKELAPDTIVLLQNNGSVLPLESGTSVALLGNGAKNTVFGGNGSGAVNASKTVSIWNAIQSSDTLTLYGASTNPFKNAPAHDAKAPEKDIEVTQENAEKYAEGADVAVIVISRDTCEGQDHTLLEGDYYLSKNESSMISRISEAFHKRNKQVIVILNTGNPIEVVSWRDSVDGVIWCGYAGQNTGNAVVSILTGEVNPSAKLTATWPTSYESTPTAEYFPGNSKDTLYYEDIYVGYRYYTTFNVSVAYEFGYGLSYTEFEYSQFKAEKNSDGTVTLSATVKNIGKVAGREIVEFYVSKPETAQEHPTLELCGFCKTPLLQPNESVTVTVKVCVEALETYLTDSSRFIIDKGTYAFSVGASVLNIKASAKLSVEKEITVLDTENRCEPRTELDVINKATYSVPTEQTETKVNIALNKTAWSDHCEGDSYGAQNAVDGDFISRWSGLGTASNSYLWQVDFGEVYEIGVIHIRWESVSAPFTVWVSEDGQEFTKWKTVITDGSCDNILNLTGAKARVIRLTVPKGGYCSIYEFQAYEATEEDLEQTENDNEKVNIARGKTVSATNVQDGYEASFATDGNIESRWAATQTGEASITVDLGRTYRIDGIALVFEAAWVPYVVECSTDGQNWTKVTECEKDKTYTVLESLNTDARYIRISRVGEDWFSIFEIFVYEK